MNVWKNRFDFRLKRLMFLLSSIVFFTIVVGMVIVGSIPESKATGKSNLSTATFAGGCFWCMEPPFEKLEGVQSVVSGFMGGHVENPTYDQVSSGGTGHIEVVQIKYNSQKVSYKKLLEVYWRQIDPTDDQGQFVDRGHQYISRIFYHNSKQKKLAEKSRKILDQSKIFDQKIVTDIVPAEKFYKANSYHQNYYQTHSLQYKYYKWNSGRDDFLEKTWKNHKNFKIFSETDTTMENEDSTQSYEIPDRDTLRNELTDVQYRVTQKDATEPAYDNKYWDHKEPGIYVDIVSGEPLFSSKHKFKSGTGWPSFYKPLVEENIVTRKDTSLLSTRTEVRSKHADSHLGHVFKDGPEPTGLRYCINSAALDFIPVDRLEEEGYEEFVADFQEN